MSADGTNTGGALPLPVDPLPQSEDPTEVEGRWVAAYFFVALATGGVLARAARQARFRWWFLNIPAMVLVAAAGSVGGSALAYVARRGAPVVLGRPASTEQRFWARFFGTFWATGWTFDQVATRLDGRALWRGSYQWWWTIGWPLAALMLFVNASEVQTRERLRAQHRAFTSDRTALRNHYALDADLTRLAKDRVPFTFVYLDLDGFKAVNDQLGHLAGDEVLAETARILERLQVVAYHLHGDEFAMLAPGRDEAAVEQLVRAAFTQIRRIGTRRGADVAATFGAAPSGEGGDADAVRHVADTQMRRAKNAGKRRVAFASGRLVDLTTSDL